MSPLTDALRAPAAAALVAGFAFAGAATATADPNTGSGADLNTLAGALSKGYGLNNCTAQAVPTGALAYLQCGPSPDPSGPMLGKYLLFGDGNDLANSFTALVAGDTVGNCGDASSPTPWHQGSSTTKAGSVACGTFQGHAEIIWTNDTKNMLGVIRSSGSDVPSLYQWWRNNG
ncbi:serine/threonine protein kinase [Mycobacterium sp. Aquia_216]|uniref:serine/threonine protein kinase n=1 Tax=Mycobacterium sp. Aquia_216 TaxID=2991729 RepID=UPI00227ABFAD|nr:serine/threonine protein kinase [Mycobacterium sp. Aquia_216]WAJ45860.1 serine/threonine protein kinase [Mycobacterium sp. Aquia_216]